MLEKVREHAKVVGLEIVMVNVWEHVNSREEALHFCKVHSIQGPVLIDAKGDYIAQLGLRGVPVNLFVNKKGIVQAVGMTTPDEVRSTLMRLLNPFAKK